MSTQSDVSHAKHTLQQFTSDVNDYNNFVISYYKVVTIQLKMLQLTYFLQYSIIYAYANFTEGIPI